jgi:hypothetical protein
MSLKVKKSIILNDQQFDGYEIVGLEWTFRDNKISILTEYFYLNRNVRRLIKHQFKATQDVDVNQLIDKVHELHP